MKQHLMRGKNCSTLAKFAVYLQIIMLYLAETEKDEIEDDSKGLNFLHPPAPVPYL